MPDKLPKGWVKTTLGEVCAFNPRPTNEDFPSEDLKVSFVPMAAVEEESGKLNPSRIRAIVEVRKGYTPFRENDILFAKITPCMENGKIALASGLKNGIGYGSTEFFVLRPHEGLHPRFILHFLLQQSFRSEAERHMTGGVGQKRVPSKYLVNHEIALPPTKEQERILARLDMLLSRIAIGESATHRALKRLHRYRAAVLHAALTGKLTCNWRKIHPPTESGTKLLKHILTERRIAWEEAELKRLHTLKKTPKNDKWKKRYKEPAQLNTDELAGLPKEWTWASLEMIAKIGSGISVSQNREVKNAVTVPYLRVANVHRGRLDLTEVKKLRINRNDLHSLLLKDGDLLFNEGGDRDKLGRGWVWENQIPKCTHQNHVFRARLFNRSLVDAKLISHWGNTFGQQFFMLHGTQTTNLASINRSVLSRMPVPIIPVAEQTVILHEVNRRLAAADRLAATLNLHLSKAQDTRQSLLREVFAGNLVSQASHDEPASMLLDRIRARRKAEANQPKAKRMPKPRLKSAETLDHLEGLVHDLGKGATPERLLLAAGLGDDVEKFFDLLRAGRDKGSLIVPIGKSTAIRRGHAN